MYMPKLRINRFRQIASHPVVDVFETRTANDVVVKLKVHQDAAGQKYFQIGSIFQVVGWTQNANDAFRFFNNACVFNFDELYEAGRGKKLQQTAPEPRFK